MPRFLLLLPSVLGGHKKQLDVMFCSPAHCGVWDERAGGPGGFPGVLCSVMSLQEKVTGCTMSPPPAVGCGGGSWLWSYTSYTQIPNAILTIRVVLKGFYFQASDFLRHVFRSL